MQKRNFHYRWLTICAFVSTLISGILAISFAVKGFGVWSLVIQGLSASLITALMLWIRSQWIFRFDFDFGGIGGMVSYGLNRLTVNLLDFANTRLIEFVIATSLGAAAIGLYAVGIKLYQALMQVLSGTVMEVALNGFARLAHDRQALLSAYYKAIFISVAVAVPPFCLLAILAPEITLVFFGEKWLGSVQVMRPMAILGAVQIAQFYNGTIFNALGKPSISMKFMIFKSIVTFFAIFAARNADLETLIYAYVCSQLFITPISFWVVKRVVGVSLATLTLHIFRPFLCILFATLIVVLCRDALPNNTHQIFEYISSPQILEYIVSPHPFLEYITSNSIFQCVFLVTSGVFSYLFFFILICGNKFLNVIKKG